MYTLIVGPIGNPAWCEAARRMARQHFPHNGLLIRGAGRVRSDEKMPHVTAAVVDEGQEGLIEFLQREKEAAPTLEIQELVEGALMPTDDDPTARATLVILAVPAEGADEEETGEEEEAVEEETEVADEPEEDWST